MADLQQATISMPLTPDHDCQDGSYLSPTKAEFSIQHAYGLTTNPSRTFHVTCMRNVCGTKGEKNLDKVNKKG
jgi:hypothetical protein